LRGASQCGPGPARAVVLAYDHEVGLHVLRDIRDDAVRPALAHLDVHAAPATLLDQLVELLERGVALALDHFVTRRQRAAQEPGLRRTLESMHDRALRLPRE